MAALVVFEKVTESEEAEFMGDVTLVGLSLVRFSEQTKDVSRLVEFAAPTDDRTGEATLTPIR
jgi:hypothetical protein